MRLTRTFSLLVAVVVAAALSAVFVAPSEARPAPASARQALPNHDLVVHGTEVGNNHFVIYGTLTTYPKVYIFRSINGGSFELYRKVKTDSNNRFRTRVYQYKNYRTCFRAGVPSTSSHDQVIKAIGCIVSH